MDRRGPDRGCEEHGVDRAVHPEGDPAGAAEQHRAYTLRMADGTAEGPYKPVDAGAFRTELLQLVDQVDSRWRAEETWHSPQGCWWSDFSGYPTVGKYI